MNKKLEDAFLPAEETVSWAHAATKEFHETAGVYFRPENREIITDVDPQTHQKVHKLRLKEPLPAVLKRKATEALLCARHGFDQATFAAQTLLTDGQQKFTYFPWASNPTDLTKLLERRGIDERLWGLFKSYEPYPTGENYAGGNDVIRALAALANRKHTLGFIIAPQVTALAHPLQDGIVMRYFLPPAWDPLRNEAVIATWEEDSNPQGDYRIEFIILFDDPKFPYEINVAAALDIFAQTAELTVRQIKSHCGDLLT